MPRVIPPAGPTSPLLFGGCAEGRRGGSRCAGRVRGWGWWVTGARARVSQGQRPTRQPPLSHQSTLLAPETATHPARPLARTSAYWPPPGGQGISSESATNVTTRPATAGCLSVCCHWQDKHDSCILECKYMRFVLGKTAGKFASGTAREPPSTGIYRASMVVPTRVPAF